MTQLAQLGSFLLIFLRVYLHNSRDLIHRAYNNDFPRLFSFCFSLFNERSDPALVHVSAILVNLTSSLDLPTIMPQSIEH